ncbi:methylated-DNA--[protein]-cysteine S-methyltransferase [Thioalkalivibrio sp. XN279]|uniref:methylated-DNA--[protein]-cysteine S-methyltransferase n=1 Tax=Thioalkalivibrio sp. XN279 TaxID=2714953 RepID=UPI00140E7990|nr:methylated-DNA--[protein]-cysteine S-methyltransferase [Thioalkalivibrio sp. XN279]
MSPKGICAVHFRWDEVALKSDLGRRFPGAELVRDDAGTAAAVAALRDWIDRPQAAPGPRLDLVGTDFQRAVWRAIARIPAGKVISYAELARQAGRPRAIRAAAQACGANPVPLLVPCHRVVASDGGLGGFGGGLPLKRKLLAREGVRLA